jgi:polyferredoxin
MDKVGFPRGLIRYASEDEIVKKEKFTLTLRMKGYIAVLSILIAVLVGLLFLRNDVEATILRLPGQLYEKKGENISNVFTYKIINKTVDDFENVTIQLEDITGEIKLVGNPNLKIPKEGTLKGTLFIELKPNLIKGDKMKVKIGIYNNGKLIETTKTTFLGPRSFN